MMSGPLLSTQFVNCAMRLCDSDGKQRRCSCIGVCNGNPPERLATSDMGIAPIVVIFAHFIIERIDIVHVSVCPAVDGYGFDIPGRIETTVGQGAGELAANISFYRFKWC